MFAINAADRTPIYAQLERAVRMAIGPKTRGRFHAGLPLHRFVAGSRIFNLLLYVSATNSLPS